jgi:hypothetical protein
VESESECESIISVEIVCNEIRTPQLGLENVIYFF